MVISVAARHREGMSENITHTPGIKRLERSSDDKWIAGVCGGLGKYFDLNPSVFRLGLVVLTLLGGAGILIYLAAVLVVPAEGADDSIAARTLAERRDRPARLVGLGLVAAAIAVLLSRADSWPTAGAGWVLVLLAGLALLWAGGQTRARPVVVALTTIFVVLVTATVAAVVIAFSAFDVSLGDGVGDRVYTPASPADVQRDYKLGIGDLEIDLSKLPAGSTAHVRADLGIGELRIVVPRDTAVVVNAHARVGELHVLGRRDDGRNARVVTGSGALRIDATVGAGRVDVVRPA